MSLPKIDLPIYDLKIPSTGQEIKVRPFKVKEDQRLLIWQGITCDALDCSRFEFLVFDRLILREGTK